MSSCSKSSLGQRTEVVHGEAGKWGSNPSPHPSPGPPTKVIVAMTDNFKIPRIKKNLKLSHPVIKGTVVSISDGRFCVSWVLHKAHAQTTECCLRSAWPHNLALGTLCLLVGVCLPIHFNYLHSVWKQIIKVFRMHLRLIGLLF